MPSPPEPVPNYLDENEDSPITLGFLICNFDDEEQWLDFTEADVNMIQELAELSKLDQHQAAALYRLFHAQGDGTDLSKQSFHDCIRHLIPGETISQENQQFLSFMLSKIFFAFDNGNRTVDCTEFSCGFRCDLKPDCVLPKCVSCMCIIYFVFGVRALFDVYIFTFVQHPSKW